MPRYQLEASGILRECISVVLSLPVCVVLLPQLWELRGKYVCFLCLIIFLLLDVWFLDFYFNNEVVPQHNSWSRVWLSASMVHSHNLCLCFVIPSR